MAGLLGKRYFVFETALGRVKRALTGRNTFVRLSPKELRGEPLHRI